MIRYIFFFFLFISFLVKSQNERSIARDGNENYKNDLFSESEVQYRKSLSDNKTFDEAKFNLAASLFKQDRYNESINILNDLIVNTDNPEIKSDAYYNVGNNFLKQQMLEEAISSYKSCLRLNPSDEQARYNLSKALSLLNQQENKNQNQESDQQNEEGEQNEEDKQDQNSGETDGDNKEDDERNQKNEKENGENKGDNDKNEEYNQHQEIDGDNLSKQEMERILDALEREEQKVQDEMRKLKVNTSNKKIEKDW